MAGKIEFGNIVLILLGIVLTVSGPVIVYRTIVGTIQRRKEDPKAKLHPFSSLLNFLIAIVFTIAGVLFILNNLRGNPLAS